MFIHPGLNQTVAKPSQFKCLNESITHELRFPRHRALRRPVDVDGPSSSLHFFDDLSGSWSSSGQAYVTQYGEISASCRVAITGAETQVAMNGSCGMLVFSQALGLTIKNAGGNRSIGTYTGSKTGPAKLDGILRGDRLVMTIMWGGLVNGNRTAQMVLERIGPNSFAQIVNDKVEGKSRSTSNFAFVRR